MGGVTRSGALLTPIGGVDMAPFVTTNESPVTSADTAVVAIGKLQAQFNSAYLKRGISARRNGIQCNGIDEAAALTSLIEQASTGRRWIDADWHAHGLGEVRFGSFRRAANGTATLPIKCNIQGGEGPPAKINLYGYCNALQVDGDNGGHSVKLRNLDIRKSMLVSRMISAIDLEADGDLLVTVDDVSGLVVGDPMAMWHTLADFSNRQITNINTGSRIITIGGGSPSTPGSIAVNKQVSITSAVRVNNKLVFTTSAPHKIMRGQTVQVNGTIFPSIRFTEQATMPSVGNKIITQVADWARVRVGDVVTGHDGILAGSFVTDTDAANGGSVTLNNARVPGLDGPTPTLTFRRRTMNVSDGVTATRAYGSTIVVDDAGEDDTAADLTGVTISVTATDNWAALRFIRAALTADGGDSGNFSAQCLWLRKCIDVELDRVISRGIGNMLQATRRLRVKDSWIEDSQLDGWHMVVGNTGLRMSGGGGINLQDDGAPIVSYDYQQYAQSDMVFEGVTVERCMTRAFLNSGGRGIQYDTCVAKWSAWALVHLWDISSYVTNEPGDATIRGFTAIGCGQSSGDYAGGATAAGSAAAMRLEGGRVVASDITLKDSHGAGLSLTGGTGHRLTNTTIDWTRMQGVHADQSSNWTPTDVSLLGLTLRDIGSSGVDINAARGRWLIRDLQASDINRSNAASQALIQFLPNTTTRAPAELVVDGLTWTEQQYGNVSLQRQGSGTVANANAQRVRWLGDIVVPVNICNDTSLAIHLSPLYRGNGLRLLATWNGEVAPLNGAVERTLTMLPGVWPATPLEMLVVMNADFTPYQVRNFATMVLRDAAVNLLIAGSNCWRNGADFRGVQLTKSLITRAMVTPGSSILQYSWQYRCDTALVGADISGTNIPAGTAVRSVDRATQRVMMGKIAAATITNGSASIGMTAHGSHVGAEWQPIAGTLTSTGFTVGTTYYVVSMPDANNVRVAATPGGAAITASANGTSVVAEIGVAATGASIDNQAITIAGMTPQMVRSADDGTVPQYYLGNTAAGAGLPADCDVYVWGR